MNNPISDPSPVFNLQIPPWLLKTIDDGLQDLPYRQAAPAINEINRQIMAQNERVAEAQTAAPVKDET